MYHLGKVIYASYLGFFKILHGCEVIKEWSDHECRVSYCQVHVFRDVCVALTSETIGQRSKCDQLFLFRTTKV